MNLRRPDVAAAVGVGVFPDGLYLACFEAVNCSSTRDTNVCPSRGSQIVYSWSVWCCSVGSGLASVQ